MNLPWPSQWSVVAVAVTNSVAALAACGIHLYAASKVRGWLRRMFMAIGSLALFYCVAYLWLALNPGRGGDWSDFLRPFGVVTWVIAWSVEPFVLLRYLRNRAEDLEQRVSEAVERRDLEARVNARSE